MRTYLRTILYLASSIGYPLSAILLSQMSASTSLPYLTGELSLT
jgi:hypothetical protein